MTGLSTKLKQVIKKAVIVLRDGGLVAYPTDTVYGLGASMNSTFAVKRIFEVKERPLNMALPLLVANRIQIEQLTRGVPPVAWLLIYNYLPGALTIVLQKSDAVPDIVTGGDKTVALRIPDHPVALALITELGVPIVGTSANLSGQPSVLTAGEVISQIGDKINMVVDGGLCPGGVESTVVDFTGSKPVIRRLGAISLEQLKSTCPDIQMAKEMKHATRNR